MYDILRNNGKGKATIVSETKRVDNINEFVAKELCREIYNKVSPLLSNIVHDMLDPDMIGCSLDDLKRNFEVALEEINKSVELREKLLTEK